MQGWSWNVSNQAAVMQRTEPRSTCLETAQTSWFFICLVKCFLMCYRQVRTDNNDVNHGVFLCNSLTSVMVGSFHIYSLTSCHMFVHGTKFILCFIPSLMVNISDYPQLWCLLLICIVTVFDLIMHWWFVFDVEPISDLRTFILWEWNTCNLPFSRGYLPSSSARVKKMLCFCCVMLFAFSFLVENLTTLDQTLNTKFSKG